MTKINELFEESTTKAVEEIDDSSIQALSELCNKLLEVEGEIVLVFQQTILRPLTVGYETMDMATSSKIL